MSSIIIIYVVLKRLISIKQIQKKSLETMFNLIILAVSWTSLLVVDALTGGSVIIYALKVG